MVPLLRAGAPGTGHGALRAGDLLAVPVDGEHVRGVPAGAGLRGAIGQQRGEQGDAAGAGGQQQLAAGIAAVGGVLAGRQAAPGQRVVHRLGHPPRRSPAPGWSRYWRSGPGPGAGRPHRGWAGLPDVQLVPGPALAAFSGVPRVQVIWRDQAGSGRRSLSSLLCKLRQLFPSGDLTVGNELREFRPGRGRRSGRRGHSVLPSSRRCRCRARRGPVPGRRRRCAGR